MTCLLKSFLSFSNLAGAELSEACLNGRAFFEAYPEITLTHPAHLNEKEVFQDQISITQYPYVLSSDVILRIHRENSNKINGFFEELHLLKKSYPKTQLLCERLIEAVREPVLYLKFRFNRQRPYQVFPGMRTVLQKPESPSYPSKDALEAMLIALTLSEFLEDLESRQALVTLAESMGKRRILAGVSFPSDVKAAQKLAHSLLPILMSYPAIQSLMPSVKEEWQLIKQSIPSVKPVLISEQAPAVLTFKQTPFNDFINNIQWLSDKKIHLHGTHDFFVNERFPVDSWTAYLDLICWDQGLSIHENNNEIHIL